MTKISKIQAVNLAETYHDAMTMVSQRYAFGIKSPEAILNDYLRACERVGVTLHNEIWLEHAKVVVKELTEKRLKAEVKSFGWVL